MLATKKLEISLVIALMLSVASLGNQVDANPNLETLPVLAMPKEYIEYTITCVNGTWWARIDGMYPMHFVDNSGDVASCVPTELPMVYPTPPNSTNIHIRVNGTELVWSNWLYDTHHTAIGDWEMIYCDIEPVSNSFLLTIHYEHPIEIVNGSYLFLYDLNIREYLTDLSNTSIAYFTIQFESEVSDIHAYTTWTDAIWKPKDFELSKENDKETITINIRSVKDEPLAGDLVVIFNDSASQVQEEFPYWLFSIPVFVVVFFLATMVYKRKC